MIYIIGPTSSGKTALAIELCKRFNGEIISADSRQIYKHFDVGTGKLPVNSSGVSVERNSGFWKIDGVKIHMYDVCDAKKLFTVENYMRDVGNLISDIKVEKNTFIVGGTGLYIDNLLGIKKPSPVPPNMKLRNQLENKSLQELQNMLPKEVLASMNHSDINNPRRLIRKIEISSSNAIFSSNPKGDTISVFEYPMLIVLDLPRHELFARVDLWVDTIWGALISEIKNLIHLGYEKSFPMQGIIYKTALEFTYQKISKNDAIQVIKNDLHAYIRRQQTWFKTYSSYNVQRFTSSDSAFSYIESILAK